MVELTTEQHAFLAGCENGLGPYTVGDINDPDLLACIVDDIALVVGTGHQEDTSWITAEHIVAYVRSKTNSDADSGGGGDE